MLFFFHHIGAYFYFLYLAFICTFVQASFTQACLLYRLLFPCQGFSFEVLIIPLPSSCSLFPRSYFTHFSHIVNPFRTPFHGRWGGKGGGMWGATLFWFPKRDFFELFRPFSVSQILLRLRKLLTFRNTIPCLNLLGYPNKRPRIH